MSHPKLVIVPAPPVPRPAVCRTCGRPDAPVSRVPMTGEELLRALHDAPHDALRRLVSLDLGPGIWADVLGVRWSSGHAEGWRLELELGRVQTAPTPEKETE